MTALAIDESLQGEYLEPNAEVGVAVSPEHVTQLALLAAMADSANDTASKATASSTRRCYATDWRDFSAFCTAHGVSPMSATPPLVRLYINEQHKAGKSVSTIGRRLAAIASEHRKAGIEPRDLPTRHWLVVQVWKGIRKETGIAPKHQKTAIEVDLVRDLARPLGSSTVDLRDKAVLLLTFTTACWRSETAHSTSRI